MSKKNIYDSGKNIFSKLYIPTLNGLIFGNWINIPGKGYVFYGTNGHAYITEDSNGNSGEFRETNLSNYDLEHINKFYNLYGKKAIPYAGKIGTVSGADYRKLQAQKLNPAGGNPAGGNPKKPVPMTHTATYTPYTGATGAYAVSGWTTNAWGNMGNKKGFLDENIATKLGLQKGATAKQAQDFLRSKGYSITSDDRWGKQSQAAFDDYMYKNNLSSTQPTTPTLPAVSTPTWTPTTTSTYNFNRHAVKGLGFNNYQGMVDYVKAHGDSDLAKSLVNRFGNVDTWNQAKVEGDLGVGGKYRAIQGDFRKITNSMNDYNKNMGYTGTQYIDPEGKFHNTEGGARARAISTLNTLNQQLNQQLNQTNTTQPSTLQTKFPTNLTTFNPENYAVKNTDFEKKLSGAKLQKGGKLNMEESQMQQAFLQFLAEQTGAKSQADLEQVIQKLGKEGLQQAYAQFMQMIQQEQVQSAKFGAKLNYINRLNGRCPEGTKLTYFKEGGKLCKKCMAIQAQGGEVNAPVKNAIEEFKSAVSRNRKKFGKKYDEDQLAGRKPVGKDSKGRDLYLNGDGKAVPAAKCGAKMKK